MGNDSAAFIRLTPDNLPEWRRIDSGDSLFRRSPCSGAAAPDVISSAIVGSDDRAATARGEGAAEPANVAPAVFRVVLTVPDLRQRVGRGVPRCQGRTVIDVARVDDAAAPHEQA